LGENGADNAFDVGDLLFFQGHAVNLRCINGGDALDGCIEVVEGFFLNEVGDLGVYSTEGFVFFDQNGPIGLFDGVDNGFFVKWANGAEVDNFGVDVVFFFEDLGGFQSKECTASVSDEGEVGAFFFYFRFAEGDEVLFFGDFSFVTVEKGVFHEKDGVVVTNGGFHEAFGIIGSCGADDFEAGGVGREVFRCVGVGSTNIGTSVGGASEDDGDVDEAAGHVADVGGVVDHLVKGYVAEAPEHEFDDRADTQHGGSDAESTKSGFRDGSVDNAIWTKFFK